MNAAAISSTNARRAGESVEARTTAFRLSWHRAAAAGLRAVAAVHEPRQREIISWRERPSARRKARANSSVLSGREAEEAGEGRGAVTESGERLEP
eukprot:scaffold3467_cov120-Isochrysis_galbana.AAC.3